jgi:hypothetical protein
VSAAQRLTHLEHPYEQLLGALQSEGETHITWSELKPWVGDRAGLFIDSLESSSALGMIEKGFSGGLNAAGAKAALGGGQTQGALLLDARDPGKARAFLKSQAAHAGAHGASFDGVSYEANAQQRAFALVGKFAVIGTQSALHGVIETVQGHPSLLGSATYTELAGAASGQALANAYLNPATLLAAGHGSGAAQTQGLGLLSAIFASAKPVYLSLEPSASSISLEALSPPATKAQSESETAGEQMFGQLPGNAWLALGIGNLGKTLEGSLVGFESLSSLASSSSGLGSLLPKVSTKGVNIKRDFLRWMGSAGVFAAGTSLVNIAAGVVITSTDPAASRAAVAKMAKLLAGSGGSVTAVNVASAETTLAVRSANSPLTIDVAAGHGKFVIGLGETSIEQALAPSSTLSGSAAYSTAQSTLGTGMKPTLMVEFPTLLGFMEGLNLQENPMLSKIFPYLRQLNTLTAGSGHTGTLTRSRLVLALR